MTTAACTSPSHAGTSHASTTRRTDRTGTGRAGTRVTAVTRALRRRWQERRNVLMPVGPEPAGPWAGSDRPDRDGVRMLAELRAAPQG